MSSQLVFSLSHRPALARADFYVSACNRAAVDVVDRYPDWADMVQGIYGAHGCGKSHLAAVWQQQADTQNLSLSALENPNPKRWLEDTGWVLDGVEQLTPAGEEGLLHLINLARTERKPLLLFAARPFAHLAIGLPDLVSRLRGLATVEMQLPDDELLAAIVAKLFADRQLIVADNVIAYMIPRMMRDYASAHRLVAQIDTAAATDKRAVTIPLIAEVLRQYDE